LVIETYKVKQCRINGTVCSEVHTEHTNVLCGQNLETLMVHKVTTGFERLISVLIHVTYQSPTMAVLMPRKVVAMSDEQGPWCASGVLGALEKEKSLFLAGNRTPIHMIAYNHYTE